MQKKKILVVSNRLAPYRVPLYEKMIDNFDAEFIWLHVWDKSEIKKLSNKIYNVSFFSDRYKKNFLGFKTSRWYEKYLYHIKYDYVLTLPPVYPEVRKIWYIVKKRKKKKLLLRDEEFKRKKSWKRKLIMPITKFINRNSDFILVPSDKHKEWQLSLWVKKEKIILFPNVTNLDLKNVDKNKIENLKKKHEIWDKKVFMYIWRLIELKWVQYLIDAYYNLIKLDKKYIKNTILIIVWDWIYIKKLKEQSKRIKDIWWNVIFTWHIDNSQLINYYKLAYTWIVPSINIKWSNEAYWLVVNEWMIAWKPVITTNMVWATYALLNNNKLKKFIVKQGNTKEIESLLKYILNANIEEYENIIGNISTIIKEYNNYKINIEILKTF